MPDMLLNGIGIISGLIGVIPAILLIFPKKKGIKFFLIVTGVIIFLVYFCFSNLKKDLVEMPKVTPNTYDNVAQLLDLQGIKYEADSTVKINDYPRIMVNSQSIKEGEIINKKKDTVILYIDNNKETNATSSQNNVSDDIQNFLYQKLKDNVEEDILCFVTDDFDNDGNYEAFAFVGELLEDDGYGEQWKGTPYFVNDRLVKKILTDTRYNQYVDKEIYWATYNIIELGKNKAVVFSVYYTTGSADEIYSVKESSPIQYKIPNVYGDINVTENFITLTVSKYDIAYFYNDDLWVGHTWKPYYFFWNEGINGFSEYGGIEITLEQLSELKDISNIIKEYENKGYNLLNILYRANGIININFECKDELSYSYQNATLYIKEYNTKYLTEDEILERNEGIYEKAINPEIAVYPAFPFE